MKLNVRASYGHVYGHGNAVYIQNEQFFDGGGNLLDEEGINRVDEEAGVEEAKEFLITLLQGTQIRKSAVVKQAEADGISWHLVESAANELGVEEFKVNKALTWKLPE